MISTLFRDKPYRCFVNACSCGTDTTLSRQTPPHPLKVFAWGNGRNGRLGLGDVRDRPSACHVEAIQGVEIEAVFCGVSHSMAVCSTGTCYAWGKNDVGQCGESDPSGSDIVSVWQRVLLGGSTGVFLGKPWRLTKHARHVCCSYCPRYDPGKIESSLCAPVRYCAHGTTTASSKVLDSTSSTVFGTAHIYVNFDRCGVRCWDVFAISRCSVSFASSAFFVVEHL